MADALAPRPAPHLVRAFSRLLQWLPLGRYRLIHESRRFPVAPFVAQLAPEFGALAFLCDARDSVAREVCYTGVYEPQETQLVARLLEAGHVFVDVGANWGYFTLAAAHRVGAAGRVLSFEPEPRLFELLTANLAMNDLHWVQGHRMGIADAPRSLRFAAFSANSGNWGQSREVAQDAPADFAADAAALDDVLDAQGVERVRMTKIDVEGGEADVLAGMTRGLRSGRYEYVLLECHPALLAERGRDEPTTLRPLTDAGYRLWNVVHTPQLHRRAARKRLAANELLRPYAPGVFRSHWPHVLAAAPAAADPR